MSSIHSVVLIVVLWAIYLIFISLFKKKTKEKKTSPYLEKERLMKKKANLLFWILMFIGIALASFSLIIDHVRISINQ